MCVIYRYLKKKISGFIFFFFLEEDRRFVSKERKFKVKVFVIILFIFLFNVFFSFIRTFFKSRRFYFNLSSVSRIFINIELLDRDFLWSMFEGEKFQWYQKQLYQVLGKGVDYFLYFKIEKKVVKFINSKFRKEGGGLM